MSEHPKRDPNADVRTHERVPLNIEVTLASENNFYAGITDNISEGGVFVATYTPPPVGAQVELELTLEGAATPYRIRGVVCWVRPVMRNEAAPPGVGIRWTEIGAQALAAITKFCRSRETILYDED